MRIEGKLIASGILSKLKSRVEKLKEKGVIPTMAIILLGDNEASGIYVRQKGIKAKEIGAEVKVFQSDANTTNETIEKQVKKLDKDPKIHGIIIQRPAPPIIKVDELTELISAVKEVDGFGSRSKYPVPVAQAVLAMLQDVSKQSGTNGNFINWLKSKKIVVIGKGETAGRPIIDRLKKEGAAPEMVDSRTQNKDDLLKKADIIVTAVGRTILKSTETKKGVILIGVGLYTDASGKLRGDYDDKDIMDTASYYSPTPGGVGPVNVACLMENLVKAAEIISNS